MRQNHQAPVSQDAQDGTDHTRIPGGANLVPAGIMAMSSIELKAILETRSKLCNEQDRGHQHTGER